MDIILAISLSWQVWGKGLNNWFKAGNSNFKLKCAIFWVPNVKWAIYYGNKLAASSRLSYPFEFWNQNPNSSRHRHSGCGHTQSLNSRSHIGSRRIMNPILNSILTRRAPAQHDSIVGIVRYFFKISFANSCQFNLVTNSGHFRSNSRFFSNWFWTTKLGFEFEPVHLLLGAFCLELLLKFWNLELLCQDPAIYFHLLTVLLSVNTWLILPVRSDDRPLKMEKEKQVSVCTREAAFSIFRLWKTKASIDLRELPIFVVCRSDWIGFRQDDCGQSSADSSRLIAKCAYSETFAELGSVWRWRHILCHP